jgi:hypothetical protein
LKFQNVRFAVQFEFGSSCWCLVRRPIPISLRVVPCGSVVVHRQELNVCSVPGLPENSGAYGPPHLLVGMKCSITPACATVATPHVSCEPTCEALPGANCECSWMEGVGGRFCNRRVHSMCSGPLGLLGLVCLPACLGVWVVGVFLEADQKCCFIRLSCWGSRIAGLGRGSGLRSVEQVTAPAGAACEGVGQWLYSLLKWRSGDDVYSSFVNGVYVSASGVA